MKQMPVLMIDNRSPLCCRIMQFIFNSGGSDKFYFLSLNSEQGRDLLSIYNVPPHIKSFMVLLDQGKIFLNAVAFLESTRKLNGKIPVFYWYTSLPEKIGKRKTENKKENYNENN